MKKLIIIAIISISFAAIAQTNKPDEKVNLALEASLTGSTANGRGNPIDIVYDIVKDNCVNADRSQFSEYGNNFGQKTESFYWQATFKEPKNVNYITFGGTYGNQPQTNTSWIISYKESVDGQPIVLDSGFGGWISNGNYIYDNAEPITIYSIKIETAESVSMHLRCRGGKSLSRASDDTANTTKGAIISFRPYNGYIDPDDVVVEPIDEDLQMINKLIEELKKRAEAYNLKNDKALRVVVVEIEK